MLEELIFIHEQVIKTTPTHFKRYLFDEINWNAQSICIVGDRGVGKTTLLCQDYLKRYGTSEKALYISADNINVMTLGLYPIAKQFFTYGGEALYIDEVHKYPEWSIEIKNILDTFKDKQVLFSASSPIELNRSKADLSRRVVYYRLLGLSFREYLQLAESRNFNSITFEDLIKNHQKLAHEFSDIPILKFFRQYLEHGYYPFFNEGIDDYLLKVQNVIEKVLFEDLAVAYNLKQTTVPILKKILWLIATSNGLIPNIDKISKNLGVSRELVYNCLEYLSNSGLTKDIFSGDKGNALVRKAAKIYINNTSLLRAMNGSLKAVDDIGTIRETFFVNQVASTHKLILHDKGDYLIDGCYVVEVGGKNKAEYQIKGVSDAYLAIDDTSIGYGNKIPLYLFGFFY